MKTFKTIFAAVLFLTVSNGMMAQTSDNANITSNATVIQPIEVIAGESLEFGTVVAGVDKTINLLGVATAGDVTTVSGAADTQAGSFIVSAAASSGVSLSFNFPENLVSGGNNLEIGDFATGYLDAGDDLIEFATASAHGFSSFPAYTVDGVSGIKVLVGATVKPLSDQAPGQYTGTISLTAEYN